MNIADFDHDRDSWISVHDLEAKSLQKRASDLIRNGMDELRERKMKKREKRAKKKNRGGDEREKNSGASESSDEETSEEEGEGDVTMNDVAEVKLNSFITREEQASVVVAEIDGSSNSNSRGVCTNVNSNVNRSNINVLTSQADWYLRQLCQTSVLEGGDAAIAALMSGHAASGPALHTGEPPKKGPGGETLGGGILKISVMKGPGGETVGGSIRKTFNNRDQMKS
jgi:hypothetical protein